MSLRKFRNDLPNHGQGRIALIIDRKQDFVVRIILFAETCEVFVGAEVHAAHGLEQACWRTVLCTCFSPLRAEKLQRSKNRQQVVNQRKSRYQQQDIAPRSEEHTSELQSRLHLVCRL